MSAGFLSGVVFALGGRLPEALFMVSRLDSKGAIVLISSIAFTRVASCKNQLQYSRDQASKVCQKKKLRAHVRRVDHVELGGRVLACEGKDGELTARVVLEEVRDVEDTVVQDHPAIGLVVVGRNLRQTSIGRS